MLVSAAIAVTLGARVPTPAVVCAAAAGYTLLQSLPLPGPLIGWVSPNAERIWASALSVIPTSDGFFATLSVSPAATRVEVLKWAAYAAAFIVGSVSARRRGQRFVVLVIFATAVAVAVITLGHGLLRQSLVYGIYLPRFEASPWLVGPLLNPNNLASYMNLGFFCGVGLLRSRGTTPLARPLLMLALMLLFAQMLVAASRGAIVAFLIVALTYAGIEARRIRARSSGLGNALILAGVLIGGGILGALAFSRQMAALLLSTDVSKLRVMAWGAQMLADFPFFGVGRGAFGAAIGAYRLDSGNRIYSHPENVVIQFLSEWGVVAGLAILVALAVTLRPSQMVQSASARGAYFGFVALFLQNQMDLGLELTSLGLSASLLLGACHRTSEKAPVSRRPLGVMFVGSLAVLAVLVCAARAGPDLATGREKLHDSFNAASKRNGASAGLEQAIRAEILRAPAAAYPFLIGAARALDTRENAMPWVSRALERDPLNGRIHFVAAEAVRRVASLPQAILHLKLAASYDAELIQAVSDRALRWTRDLAMLLQCAPEGERGGAVLLSMAGKLQRDETRLREHLLSQAVAKAPGMTSALHALGNERLWSLLSAQKNCIEAREHCIDAVEGVVNELRRRAPQSAAWVMLRAGLYQAKGEWDEADRFLGEHCAKVDPKEACYGARLETSARSGDTGLILAAVAALRDNCGGADACARAELAIHRRFIALGWRREAIGPLRRSVELAPTSAGWLDLAKLATELELRAEARRAIQRVIQNEPEGSALSREALALESSFRSPLPQ
jgi:tetratricopeptide (TPR) repeat protein